MNPTVFQINTLMHKLTNVNVLLKSPTSMVSIASIVMDKNISMPPQNPVYTAQSDKYGTQQPKSVNDRILFRFFFYILKELIIKNK